MRGLHRSRTYLRPIFRPSPGPCRQLFRQPFRHGGGQGRCFHYQPNPNPNPYYQKPFKSRIWRGMVLGSFLTSTGFFSYLGYVYYRVYKAQAVLEAESNAKKQVYEDFAPLFAEARGAQDHDRLREVTFGFVRRLLSKHSDGYGDGDPIFEVGPLPPLPEDHELHGKELIPPEDTLMFVEKDEDRYISFVQVAVNLDLEEVDAAWDSKPSRHRLVDAADDYLGELLTRFEYQVEFWRNQDKLRGGQLIVVFALRDKFWTFSYTYDPWASLGIITSFD